MRKCWYDLLFPVWASSWHKLEKKLYFIALCIFVTSIYGNSFLDCSVRLGVHPYVVCLSVRLSACLSVVPVHTLVAQNEPIVAA